MFDLTEHQLTTIGTWAEVAILLWMVGESYAPKLLRLLRGRGMSAREMMAPRPGLLGGFWENRTLILAVVGLAIIAWLHFQENSAQLPPQIQGYTQAELDDAIAKAAKPLKEQLDRAQQTAAQQVTEAVARATAQLRGQIAQLQSDAPANIDRLPTSLRLFFNGKEAQEIEAKNVFWTLLVGSGQPTFYGLPTVYIFLVFKKPITFKRIQVDDHGMGARAETIINPHYAVIQLTTPSLNGLIDITPSNAPDK